MLRSASIWDFLGGRQGYHFGAHVSVSNHIYLKAFQGHASKLQAHNRRCAPSAYTICIAPEIRTDETREGGAYPSD